MTRILLVPLAISLGLVAPAADFATLTGKKAAGTLVQVDKEFVTLRTDAGETQKLAVKEMALVDLKNAVAAPTGKHDEVELTDGSLLRVTDFKVKGKAVEVTLLGANPPKVEVPLAAVYWVMRSADEPKNRDDWKKLLAARGKRDLFVVRQAEGLGPLPGTVIEGSEAGDRVTFEREDGQRVTLPLTRASGGLVFNQVAKDVIPPTACKVYDVLGNVWYATAVEVTGSGLKVKTVSGATVEFPQLTGVSKLDFSQGNVTYLSDLEAVATYPPAEKDGPLGEQFPFAVVYQKDRPIGAAEIVLDGRKFPKGVSVPPDATLVYKLDGTHREFKATVGILDGVKPDNGALKLTIEVDGRAVFAETIAKKDKPRELNLNVKDAKELKIVVERGDLFSGNQVNLADARLQK